MAKKQRRRAIEKHPLFDYSYEEEVSFECPVRGIVTQKVTVSRFKSQAQAAREAAILKSNDKFDDILEGDELYEYEESSEAEE
jgi:hypothetical protein